MSFGGKDNRRSDKFSRSNKHFVGKDWKKKNIRGFFADKKDEANTGNGRQANKEVAEETCEILQKVEYEFDGSIVHLKILPSETFSPEGLEGLEVKKDKAEKAEKAEKEKEKKFTKFTVIQEPTVQAIWNYKDTPNLAVLSFSSAKNPGGGFLTGANAQEESLARATGLYECIKDSPMYVANQADNRRCLYQDYMIWSPKVPVFRDSNDELVEEPIYVDILSVPAVNEGEAVKKGVSKDEIDETRYKRMTSFLNLFKGKGASTLILGAWGTGVFGGDTQELVDDFETLFVTEFENVFDEVVFAVLKDDDLELFKVFNTFPNS